jgi:hypothetical protein
MAPDESSRKAGQGLAGPAKWVSRGADEQTVWGECSGSGAAPYQTIVALDEPAFRCSCPSRKFPCKHALGLFLMLSAHPDQFPPAEPPPWVATWLQSRATRAERKAKMQDAVAEAAPVEGLDPEQAQRSAARQAKTAGDRRLKVDAGLAELELWLGDLVRRGLASLGGESYAFWEAPAARLVDAQAPGVARRVRALAGVAASGDGWPERLLERLARIALLIEAYRRLDSLPDETQAEVRTQIGWTQAQEELLKEQGVRDRWVVLGSRVELEDRLQVQRTWLWGVHGQQPALLLSFAHGAQPLERSLPPGASLDADLVFFRAAVPLRALIQQRHQAPEPVSAMPGHATVAEAIAAYASALARNPWLETYPMPLQAVVPTRFDGHWIVRDAAGQWLPLAPRFARGWHLLALGGGHPMSLFGEWDGEHLLPLSAAAEGRFHAIDGPG